MPEVVLDSDKNIDVRGKVLSLQEIPKRPLFLLILENKEKTYNLDLPLPIKTSIVSNFELIPYRSAIVGSEVEYSKKYEEWQEGTSRDWKLKFLTGNLQGTEYHNTIPK